MSAIPSGGFSNNSQFPVPTSKQDFFRTFVSWVNKFFIDDKYKV